MPLALSMQVSSPEVGLLAYRQHMDFLTSHVPYRETPSEKYGGGGLEIGGLHDRSRIAVMLCDVR